MNIEIIKTDASYSLVEFPDQTVALVPTKILGAVKNGDILEIKVIKQGNRQI